MVNDQLELTRMRAVINKEIDPAKPFQEFTDSEVAAALTVIIADWSIFDRRTIFVSEAVRRLRGPVEDAR